jgi:hypothetical protein
MGQTIESEINADAWKNARNFASAECGNAKDLTKNTLHIGYRLAWLWERGHHSASLERLVESILNFA